MPEKMEIQEAMEVWSRFFSLLDKQMSKDDAKPAIYRAGDTIALTVEKTTGDGKLVLTKESELALAAAIFSVSDETRLGQYIRAMRTGGWSFALDVQCKEPLKSFNEELTLFMQQRMSMDVDLEKFLAVTQPLADKGFVDSLLMLIRELDPQRADEVEAAMRGVEAAMRGDLHFKDDEIAELRRQLADMQAQRDEAIDIAKAAMATAKNKLDPAGAAQEAGDASAL